MRKLAKCLCASFQSHGCSCTAASSSVELAFLSKAGDMRQTPTQHLYDLFFDPLMQPRPEHDLAGLGMPQLSFTPRNAQKYEFRL